MGSGTLSSTATNAARSRTAAAAAMISFGVSAGVALPDHTVTSRQSDTQPLSSTAPRTSIGRSLRSNGIFMVVTMTRRASAPRGG